MRNGNDHICREDVFLINVNPILLGSSTRTMMVMSQWMNSAI